MINKYQMIMKPLRIFLFLLCSVFTLKAQPVLTTAQMPQDQDIVIHTYLDYQNLTVGPAGANVTWDYSAAVPNGYQDSGKYEVPLFLPPGNYPYNMAYRFRFSYNGSSPNVDYFDYFISTPDSLTRTGMDHNISDFHPVTFRNPAPLLRYPMTYGDAWHETTAGEHQSIIGPRDFTGISYVHADGYGTLIMPNATLSNVLRVHVVDTFFQSGSSFEFSSTYYFYQPQQRYPVLVHCDRNYDQGFAWIGSNFVATGLEETPGFTASVFPNPTHSEVRISWEAAESRARLKIINVKGQVVRHAEIANHGIHSVKELGQGMYFLEVTLESGQQHREKLLILH